MLGTQRRQALLVLLAALVAPKLSPAQPAAQPQAQLGMPVLHNYSTKDTSGVINQVWGIIQDRRGVMFFATSNAVAEYDGVTWRRIAIPSSTSRSFAMDASGK